MENWKCVAPKSMHALPMEDFLAWTTTPTEISVYVVTAVVAAAAAAKNKK